MAASTGDTSGSVCCVCGETMSTLGVSGDGGCGTEAESAGGLWLSSEVRWPRASVSFPVSSSRFH